MRPVNLSRLGLGTAPLAGLFGAVPASEAQAVVDRAWELGVRFFDTAPSYGSGLAEQRVGEALCRRPRGEFVISTKVGRLLRPGQPDPAFVGAPELAPVFDFSYDGAVRSLEESLERMGLDRVDIALIHDPDDHYESAIAGAYVALERLRSEGVVNAIGVGMNQTKLLARFARESDIDCLLVAGRYTLLDRSAADELLPLCHERGIAVIVGGIFNSGILANGETYDYRPAPKSIRARVEELRRACERHATPLAAAAIQFPLRHPAVTTVLVGCRSAAEIAEDSTLLGCSIPAELWSELEA